MERRLAAILAADVVGYSQLMGADQSGTLDALRQLRRELFDPIVAGHRGNVVKRLGDGWIVEFSSISDAVACAVAIQDGLIGHDTIRLRIGIHTGEVVFEADDVFGDGVNVAARLEALADPGQVLISDTAHNGLDGKAAKLFKGGETHELKNIARPVAIWRWPAENDAIATTVAEAFALPDKPSIAVLPFTNMSGDPEQEYFSDGITEDIITELSRFRSLFVIARNSSFHYKGQSPKIQDVGRELGVHYVVEGSVRKAGNRVRVTAQLIEAQSGSHLWAERYDRNLENIFDVQDEVVREIAASIPGQLNVAAMERARRRPAENLSAYDCLMRGEWLMFRDFTDPDVIPLFERAVKIDPQCARAYVQLARLHAYSFTQGVPVDKAMQRALPLAARALELSPSDPSIQALAANTYMMLCEHDLARQHMARAISLNPNDGEVMATAVYILNYLGGQEEALRWMSNHLRHDPISSDGYRENAIDLYYMARRYEDAIEVYRGWRNPPIQMHVEIAASYAQNGQSEEAKAAFETYLRKRPEGHDIADVIRQQLRQCAKPEDAEHWREGYRKVGLDL